MEPDNNVYRRYKDDSSPGPRRNEFPVTAYLSEGDKRKLEEMTKEKYRSPSLSHTIKRMIQDTYKDWVGDNDKEGR